MVEDVGEGGTGGCEAVVPVLREVELKLVLLGADRQDLLLPVNNDVLCEESDVLNTTRHINEPVKPVRISDIISNS